MSKNPRLILALDVNSFKQPKYFIDKLLEEGILLYSREPLMKFKNFKCKEFLLISYSLKNLTHKDKMKIKAKKKNSQHYTH